MAYNELATFYVCLKMATFQKRQKITFHFVQQNFYFYLFST